jgi:putative oligomerization/nucleic acid binding protein
MHGSTRILLLVVAAVAILAGWWILLANNGAVVGIIYSSLWTVIVLVVARVLTALGFGYNRFTAKRSRDGRLESTDAATALAELSDLRERGLISPDEHDAKRAKIVERL